MSFCFLSYANDLNFSSGEDVCHVAISLDNSLVVTSAISSISAWRLSNGQRMFSVSQDHAIYAAPICLLEKEKKILMAAFIKSSIKLYDLQAGSLALEIDDNSESDGISSSLCLCPMEDQSVLYASTSNLATTTTTWVRQANLHTYDVLDIAQISSNQTVQFIGVTKMNQMLLALTEGSPNTKKESSVQTFFTLELWDLKRKVVVHQLVEPSSKVRCFTLSMDKSKALTLGNSRFSASANVFHAEIKIFDLVSGEVIQRLLKYPSSIHLVQYIDSSHVITASRDKIIRLWDLERSAPPSAVEELKEEQAEVEIVGMYGHHAICWEKHALRVVDLQAGHFIHFVNGVKPQIVFVDDNKAILVSCGKMSLFDLNKNQMIVQFEGGIWNEGLVNGCFIHTTHEVVAVNSDQKFLCVYDMHSGQRISQMKCEHIRRSAQALTSFFI